MRALLVWQMRPGIDLFSRKVALTVSSALRRFTSVFGMGTGGTISLRTPERA